MGVLSPRPRGRLWGASATALLCLSLGLAASTGPAEADKVGVAAAVNPDAFSSLSGSPQSQLNIGKSIFFNERINTTTSGLVQVLLVDGSTFTVGPGSDLVIDKFVYDPKKGTGQIAASFSKGVMRFVGGKISKNEGGVTVDTPAGALAIRGGIAYVDFKSPKTYSILFVFGEYLKLQGQTLFEPGYGWFSNNGQWTTRPFNGGDLKNIMTALTNSNGGTANTPDQGAPKSQVVETLSLQDMVADATATQINDTLQKDETTPPPVTNTNNPPPPDNPPPDNPPPDNPPPPQQLTLRVLTPPNTYTAYGTPFENPAKNGILGGDDDPGVNADDFIKTLNIENGSLVGTVSDLNDGSGELFKPADVKLPGTLDCLDGICPISLDNDATITQGGQITHYVGYAILEKGFYAYNLVSADSFTEGEHGPDRLLAFGGTEYTLGAGKLYSFVLTPDVTQSTLAPFASTESTGGLFTAETLGDGATVSPLLLLTKDATAGSRDVWLQTSFAINGEGGDQQSFINIALGGIDPVTGGLVGARRGGSSVDVTTFCPGLECGPTTKREAFAFTGDIATLAGPDGSHFLGKDEPNIVIGFDSTGTHNIGRDIPLRPNSSPVENQSGSTYHIGIGNGPLDPESQPGQTLDGQLNGYAVGMVKSEIPASNFLNVVASTSPADFNINFNKATNTLFANLTVHSDILGGGDGATDAYHVGFGDPQTPANKSAYIDDVHYAAIETPGGTSVYKNNGTAYPNAQSTAYLASGEQLGVNNFLQYPTYNPETQQVEMAAGKFCQDCDFLQWGAWGARFGFGEQSISNFTDNVHLGWWVVGDVITDEVEGDLPFTGNAYYSGNAIGNVANNLSNQGWTTYVATGNMNMSWDFGERSGRFDITNFDKPNTGGLNFRGDLSMPEVPTNGLNKFTGALLSTTNDLPQNLSSLRGDVTGSFVRPLNEGMPSGALGNWNIGNNNYRATGIFAGGLAPAP